MTETITVGHVHDDDLPWVQAGPVGLKVLRASSDTWVVRNRFPAGFQLPKHKHTGGVHAHTFSGRWRYAEYGIDYVAGTFIYEPPGSVHTLMVLEDDTEILFVIQGVFIEYAPTEGEQSATVDDGREPWRTRDDGASEDRNIEFDETGQISGVVDAESTLNAYLALCDAAGLPRPTGILR
ncbi:2,4'-dihydroxyacetophenone dioxygenase family protein [Actinomadura gamaensis]|uniref:2,4'-dihydroxyacetophenone dioxygenase family protein n=1 Tax=Actinomadura gamaensis TaxID=1763541 RepID=A0ABV9U5N1_9ACTN